MTDRLEGKIAVITGGCSGNDLAMAETFIAGFRDDAAATVHGLAGRYRAGGAVSCIPAARFVKGPRS